MTRTSKLMTGLLSRHLQQAVAKSVTEIGIVDPARVSSLLPSSSDTAPGTVGAWNRAVENNQAERRKKRLG